MSEMPWSLPIVITLFGMSTFWAGYRIAKCDELSAAFPLYLLGVMAKLMRLDYGSSFLHDHVYDLPYLFCFLYIVRRIIKMFPKQYGNRWGLTTFVYSIVGLFALLSALIYGEKYRLNWEAVQWLPTVTLWDFALYIMILLGLFFYSRFELERAKIVASEIARRAAMRS